MAGIGIKLNRIYEKNSLVTHVAGMFYSTFITVAPMVLVMINIVAMSYFLDYSHAGYGRRALFAGTVLYMFIFSMIAASPYNSLISRYVSDVIYEEKYEDIMPCIYTGLIFNTVTAAAIGIPFCIHEWFVGEVEFIYVFMGFMGYMGLGLVLYFMLYMSICKDYTRITVFYTIGMLIAFIVAFVMSKLFKQEITFSMVSGLAVGFYVIAVLEFGLLKGYFVKNSRNYKGVLVYFRKYWQLIIANFAYTLGLYVHNFVFWTSDLRIIVVKSFYMCEPYDMATYIALLTNISSTVILITNLEMRFHNRYKDYSEAVIGGKLNDIVRAQNRMFRTLMSEIMGLVRTQFIITMVLFLVCIVILPLVGFSGLILQIYPVLAAAYFVVFLLYGSIVFLYYFNDLLGAVLVGVSFCVFNLLISVLCKPAVPSLFGLGCFISACIAWTIGFFRLRWVEKNIDRHIFCTGNIMKRGVGAKPTQVVYKKGSGNIAEEERRTGAAYAPLDSNKDEKQKATAGEKKKSIPKNSVEMVAIANADKAKENRAKRENLVLASAKPQPIIAEETKNNYSDAGQDRVYEAYDDDKYSDADLKNALRYDEDDFADKPKAVIPVETKIEKSEPVEVKPVEVESVETKPEVLDKDVVIMSVDSSVEAKIENAEAKKREAAARAEARQIEQVAKAESKQLAKEEAKRREEAALAAAAIAKKEAAEEKARLKREAAAAKAEAKARQKAFKAAPKRRKNEGAVEVASVLTLDSVVMDKAGVVKKADNKVAEAVEKHNDIVRSVATELPVIPPRRSVNVPTVENVLAAESDDSFKYDFSDDDANYKYEESGLVTVDDLVKKEN